MAAARDADEVSYLRTKEMALRKEKEDLREEQLLLLRRQSGACLLSVFVRACRARSIDS